MRALAPLRLIFSGIGPSVREAAGWRWWPWYLVAVGLTPLIIWTGWDDSVRRLFVEGAWLGGLEWRWFWWTLGSMWHVLVGATLLAIGLGGRRTDLKHAGAAVLQALLVVFSLTLLLKTATGRHGAYIGAGADAFHFFELSGQRVKMKWPSGHTSTAVAAALALVAALPHLRWLPWLLAPVVGLVVWTLLDGDYHWLSDITAGALLAAPPAWCIGRRFHRRYRPDEKSV